MNKETLKERLKEYFEDNTDAVAVESYNNYCRAVGYTDDIIYENNKYFFDEMFSNAWDAVSRLTDCYKQSDEWIHFNGYGNLESANDLEHWIELDDIIDHIIDEDDDLENTDIREILNESENEN